LLWVLELGANEHYRLKVGMGKPLGMGSVKVTPTLHLIDRVARYSTLFDGDDWASGLQSEETAQRLQRVAIDVFERFVLDQVAPSKKELRELNRIGQLLAMLSWPGPDPTQTRYMEIKHPETSRNEYARRPVLPSPLSLIGSSEPAEKSVPAKPSPTAPRAPLPKPSSMTTIAEVKKTQPLRREKRVETVVLCTPVSGKGNATVRTESVQEVLCRKFPSWQTPKVNERVKAEVIYEGEKAIEASWKSNL